MPCKPRRKMITPKYKPKKKKKTVACKPCKKLRRTAGLVLDVGVSKMMISTAKGLR